MKKFKLKFKINKKKILKNRVRKNNYKKNINIIFGKLK